MTGHCEAATGAGSGVGKPPGKEPAGVLPRASHGRYGDLVSAQCGLRGGGCIVTLLCVLTTGKASQLVDAALIWLSGCAPFASR